MIKRLDSVAEYMEFINEINSDPSFGDPMLSNEEQIQCNLLDAPSKPNNQTFGVFDNNEIIGLFVFLVLEDEAYMEMLVGLSKCKAAYDELMSYLKEHFKGYTADFVYNPQNHLLHSALQAEDAQFETEQQKMVLQQKEVTYKSCHQIELYSDKYKAQYIAMHSTDVYWTAEKVINALDRFRIILAIENSEVVGYIDVTHKYNENEPFDVFVKEEYRKKGYAKAMLAKAIELNKPNDMMLLVDTDNTAALALYESMGFVKAIGENNITAHVIL